MATQLALLGSARLNNFRLNYLPADLRQVRETYVRIILGGTETQHPGAPTRVLWDTVTIDDRLNDEPNTCQLTFVGAAPQVGQALRIVLNSNAPRLLFNGELQVVDRTYKGRPSTVVHPARAIDDTARANRRRPLDIFTNVSATTVAQQLIATYAPGFSSAGVEANLPPVTVTFDGSEAGLKGCLTQIAKLIGGYWYVEDLTLYLFLTPPGPSPDPIDDTPQRFLDDPHITWTIDKSQVRTRVYGKGASARLAADVDPAAALLLPLENAVMFNALGGGQAIAGTTPDGAASQVLRYTGVQLGGGGGLVGPGAGPSFVPICQLCSGLGVTPGLHDYAVSFVTAAGESLVGPRTSLYVGAIPDPSTALIAQPATSGGAVDDGTHAYVVTFFSGSGETRPSPVSNAVVTGPQLLAAVDDPTTAAAAAVAQGNGPDPGTYDYVVTFRNAAGETLPGPASPAVTTSVQTIPPPSNSLAFGTPVAGGARPFGSRRYVTTFVNSVGETTPGPFNEYRLDPLSPPIYGPQQNTATTGGALTPNKTYYYMTSYVTADGETTAGGQGPSNHCTLGPSHTAVQLNNIDISTSPTVVARKLYRCHDAPGANNLFYFIGQINNNTATTFLDTMSIATALLNPTQPATNTAGPKTVPLRTIPIGGAGVTGRKVYRTDAAGVYKLLATLSNNTVTDLNDTLADASLGATAPTANTTGILYSEIHLTGIPKGGTGTTSRSLYRRLNFSGAFRLVTTIANNSSTTFTDTVENSALGANAPTSNTTATFAYLNTVPLVNIPLGPANPPVGTPSVLVRNLYRQFNGAGPFRFLATLADNTTTSFTDTVANTDLSTAAPIESTAFAAQVAVTVPTGGTSVTKRRLYRSAANSTVLQFLLEIADNTTTVIGPDAAPDSALGGPPPVSDMSGLKQPEGQILPGATAVIVADATAFDPGGGWAVIGNGEQVIRYHGTTAGSLVGVPASGPGAVTAAVSYNSTITAAAALVGVTGVVRPFLKGAPVHVWVQRDDLSAQAYMAGLDGGGDGVYEHIVSDERRSEASLAEICEAQLALYARPIVTVTYATHDTKTKSGQTVTVTLDSPRIAETLTIQSVTITKLGRRVPPHFAVSASSVRQSFEAILRMLIRKADA